MSETPAQLFDNVAHRYNQSVENTGYIAPQWFREKLLTLQLDNSARVLDLGCANGINGHTLKQLYPTVSLIGVDVSQNMIVEAESSQIYEATYLHDLNYSLSFLVADSFDLVIALGFIEFLENAIECLAEISRLLKPKGNAILSFQYHEPDRADAPRITRSDKVNHYAYTKSEIKKMLAQCGLQIELLDEVIGYTTNTGYACPYIMVQSIKPTTRAA